MLFVTARLWVPVHFHRYICSKLRRFLLDTGNKIKLCHTSIHTTLGTKSLFEKNYGFNTISNFSKFPHRNRSLLLRIDR